MRFLLIGFSSLNNSLFPSVVGHRTTLLIFMEMYWWIKLMLAFVWWVLLIGFVVSLLIGVMWYSFNPSPQEVPPNKDHIDTLLETNECVEMCNEIIREEGGPLYCYIL